jgi:hypothetical protein
LCLEEVAGVLKRCAIFEVLANGIGSIKETDCIYWSKNTVSLFISEVILFLGAGDSVIGPTQSLKLASFQIYCWSDIVLGAQNLTEYVKKAPSVKTAC